MKTNNRVKPNKTDVFTSHVQGIPCLIKLDYYSPAHAGNGWDEPPSSEDIEYTIHDRKGYQAAWLERKVTPSDEQTIWLDFDYWLKRNNDYFNDY